MPPARTAPRREGPGRAGWRRIRSASGVAGPSSSWTPRIELAGDPAELVEIGVRAAEVPGVHVDPAVVGAGAGRTTSSAVARSGILDHGSHSMWTSRPCSAARSHKPGEGLRRASMVQVPPKTSTAFIDRAPTASATAKSSASPKRKTSIGIVVRRRCGCRTPRATTTRPGRARPRPGRGRPAWPGGRRR